MKCRACSAEIAEKAIVCYRCGAPTAIAEPVHRPKAPSKSRSRLLVLLILLAVLIGLLVFTYTKRQL